MRYDNITPQIPRLQGIVMSGAAGGAEPLVAGVLLPYVPKSKTLGELTKAVEAQAGGRAPAAAMARWKEQMTSAARHLHDSGVAIGGRTDCESPWSYINQWTIRVTLSSSKKVETSIWQIFCEQMRGWC